MNNSAKQFCQKYRTIITIVLACVATYIAVLVLVKERLSDLTETITKQVTEQETLLASLAEITARNGADVTAESIVRDCNVQERSEFDDMLGKLDKGLSPAELTKLERLFGRCGSFYAQRKSLMVARLGREIEVYSMYVNQLKVLTDEKTVADYKVEAWRNLAEEEQKQSELFSKLVVLQDNIITTLLAGKSAKSEEIKAILQEVKETQEMLFVTSKQTGAVRSELISS